MASEDRQSNGTTRNARGAAQWLMRLPHYVYWMPASVQPLHKVMQNMTRPPTLTSQGKSGQASDTKLCLNFSLGLAASPVRRWEQSQAGAQKAGVSGSKDPGGIRVQVGETLAWQRGPTSLTASKP